MVHVTIREVPDEVVNALKEEAAAYSVSLNAVLRSALAEHAERRRRARRGRELLPRIEALHATIRREVGGDLPDSTPLIREERDR